MRGRLKRITKLGITPMAMLYRDESGHAAEDWRRFQRCWARPAIIHAKRGAIQ